MSEFAPHTPTVSSISQVANSLTDVTSHMEQAIVAQLDVLKALGFKVMAVPDRLDDLSRSMPQGCVLVHWDRSMVNPPDRMGVMVQSEVQVFAVTIASNSLRTSNGAQLILRLAQLLLVGCELPHSRGAAYLLSKKFVGVEPKAKLWEYRIELAVPTLIVQAAPADATVLLEQITLLRKSGELFLEVPNEV